MVKFDVSDSQLEELLDIEFANEIIELINIVSPNSREPKYSNKYYLYNIILLLTDLQKWKSLSLLHRDKKKNHYKTIQDKHLEWSKLNIYEDAYRIMLKKYKHIDLKKSANLVLFIDSSIIYNKNGNENIGFGQNPKKQDTVISAICDENKVIHSLIVTKTQFKKRKRKNKNNTETTIKTHHADVKTVIPSICNLLETNLKYRHIKLVGDKGYIMKKNDKEELLNLYNIEMIHPHRRNQKEKTPKNSKKLLKKRYVIENVFANLKKFDRICMRKDRLESTFRGFLFLATILTFKK